MLSTYTDFLSGIGAPVERILSNAHLAADVCENGQGYVPVRTLCEFVDRARQSQAIDEIGSVVAQRAGIGGLQRGTSVTIVASPTLFEGLRTLCNLAYRESSRVSLWLEETQQDLLLCHRGSFPRNTPGQVEMTWWVLGLFTEVIRLFLGPRWVPARMGVPSQGNAGPKSREIYPNARFVPEPEHAWLAIPRRWLASPPRPNSLPSSQESNGVDEPGEDLVEALRQALRACAPDSLPDIAYAAEIVGTSIRTLQRRLGEQDRTYSRLAEEVRFENARELLASPDMKVIDVAFEAGYADPSHFTRAFRRIAGVTPRQYRRMTCPGT